MRDAVFAVCFKVYSTLSARRFMSDLRDAHGKGHIGCVPHFNSIFNHLDSEHMTAVLRELIVKSSLPLTAIESDFAADSTGFTASRFYRWYDHKYGPCGGERKETDWVKTHLMIGVTTHIVTAVEIHERCTNDSPLLPVLLDQTAKNFTVSEVSADRQYASSANFEAIAKHGATPYIPFRAGTTKWAVCSPRRSTTSACTAMRSCGSITSGATLRPVSGPSKLSSGTRFAAKPTWR